MNNAVRAALLACFVWLGAAAAVTAQNAGGRGFSGTDFWFGLMQNNIDQTSLDDEIPEITITVSSGVAGPEDELAFQLEVPGMDFASDTFRFSGGSAFKISTFSDAIYQADWQMPVAVARHIYARNRITGGVLANGARLRVIDEDEDGVVLPVEVVVTNWREFTADAAMILPAGALGPEYVVQAYDENPAWTSYNFASTLIIVATENETEIEITPSIELNDFAAGETRAAGETYAVRLDKGETYWLTARGEETNQTVITRDANGTWQTIRRTSASRGLTGTRVRALDDKKIAVFGGNECTSVGISEGFCDHLYEQVWPSEAWGDQYALTGNYARADQQFRFVAQEANTTITFGDAEGEEGTDYTTFTIEEAGGFADATIISDSEVD